MTETVAIVRPSVTKPVARRRPTKPTTVSASALALHLDCTRTYIGKLEAKGVIQRQDDGFPLDQSRVAYLRHLRRTVHALQGLLAGPRLPYKRSHLVALRSTKITASDPLSTWWPGEL